LALRLLTAHWLRQIRKLRANGRYLPNAEKIYRAALDLAQF